MFTVIGIIIGFLATGFMLISYLEFKEEQRNQKEFKENFKKFETRTGALHNDRVNERTTIPKKNGK
jgi:uncharacterized membrane-anchored protein YhcB (DUF1043 family)|tara:strand:+ start:1353 stop:1550 length:198 start_codon:yes stop_codon:yes gene_type:complete